MQFCWTTINVKDMDTSLTFYQSIVGLKIARKMKPNPDMEIVFLGEGDTQIELIWNSKNTDINFGKDISLGFVVDSLDKCTEILSKHNISVHSGPFQPNPKMKFLYVLDPNGLKIQFVENT
jgi:lactoylglutathione lyase